MTVQDAAGGRQGVGADLREALAQGVGLEDALGIAPVEGAGGERDDDLGAGAISRRLPSMIRTMR